MPGEFILRNSLRNFIIAVDRDLQTFLSEGCISCSTTVRGPNIKYQSKIKEC